MTQQHEDGRAVFEALVGELDYPMFVVTTAAGSDRSGCLVGFATQVSIQPPRYLVAISVNNRTHRVATNAQRLAVHVLGSEQVDLASLFGEQTGDEVDKFARCSWTPGPDGVPILAAAAGWFSGPIVQRQPFGDHEGFVVEPDAGRGPSGDVRPLSFAQVRDFDPGKEAD